MTGSTGSINISRSSREKHWSNTVPLDIRKIQKDHRRQLQIRINLRAIMFAASVAYVLSVLIGHFR